jgi:hypothetical protein
MKLLSSEKREVLIFWLALIVAKLSFIASTILLACEIYVRWNINKDFTFLGGLELEVLILSTFALIIAIIYRYR